MRGAPSVGSEILERDPALSFCLSMISGQTLRVCPEGKPVPTFPDHALLFETIPAGIRREPAAEFLRQRAQRRHHVLWPPGSRIIQRPATKRRITGAEDPR